MPKKNTNSKAKLEDILPKHSYHDDFEEPKIHNHYYNFNKKDFNFGKVAFGLTLVMLGMIYLAVNTGWLPEYIKPDLWKLWPLLIVFYGLSLIGSKTIASILIGSIATMTVIAASSLLIINQINSQEILQQRKNTIYQQPIPTYQIPTTTSTETIIP